MKISFVAPHTSDKASSQHVSNPAEENEEQNDTSHSAVVGSHTAISNDHRANIKGRYHIYQQ